MHLCTVLYSTLLLYSRVDDSGPSNPGWAEAAVHILQSHLHTIFHHSRFREAAPSTDWESVRMMYRGEVAHCTNPRRVPSAQLGDGAEQLLLSCSPCI